VIRKRLSVRSFAVLEAEEAGKDYRQVGPKKVCSLERDAAGRRCRRVEVGRSSPEEKPAAEDMGLRWER
jgi:hypothetical protein